MAVPTSNGSTVGELSISSGRKAWRWDGTLWQLVEFIPPVASGGTEADLTNPDGDGKNYHKHTFSNGQTFTVTTGGWINYLVVASGTSGYAGNNGHGGKVREGWMYIPAGTYTITVAAGASGGAGNASAIGSLVVAGVTQFGPSSGTGADALTSGSSTGHTSSISGTSVTYSRATGTSTNPGDGGNNGGATVAGTVIIRYER